MKSFFYRWWLKVTRPAMLVAWLGDGRKPVTDLEAQRRADICLKCPANKPFGKLATEAAVAVKKMGQMKGSFGLGVQNEDRLHFCHCCSCWLPAKIWVDYVHIKQWQQTDVEEEIRRTNGDCWQL